MREFIERIIRHGVSALAGVLVSTGIIAAQDEESVMAAMMTVGLGLLSYVISLVMSHFSDKKLKL